MQSVNNREEEVARVNDMMECKLSLVGATAIEDKLQDGVSSTIQYMRAAGIKVWVLTGDKIETAINIGYSSGLLDNEMEQIFVIKNSELLIREELEEGKRVLKEKAEKQKVALIVSGESLLYIMDSADLKT